MKVHFDLTASMRSSGSSNESWGRGRDLSIVDVEAKSSFMNSRLRESGMIGVRGINKILNYMIERSRVIHSYQRVNMVYLLLLLHLLP
jgi:hypothetical protein